MKIAEPDLHPSVAGMAVAEPAVEAEDQEDDRHSNLQTSGRS
jgi:hypothetical protein